MAIKISNEDRQIIELYNHTCMIGTLNKELEMYITEDDYEEYINFYIKPLAYEPEGIESYNKTMQHDENFITCPNEITKKKLGLDDIEFKFLDAEKRKEILKKKLSDKLLIFKPELKIKVNRSGDEVIYKNLRIQEIITYTGTEKDIDELWFHIVPTVNITSNSFEKKVLTEEYIHFRNSIPSLYWPETVSCGDYLYHVKCTWVNVKEDIKNKKINKDFPINIEKYKVDQEMENFIGTKLDLLFIEDTDFNNILEKENLYSKNSPTKEIEKKLDHSGIDNSKSIQNNGSIFSKDEYQFLKNFENYTKSEGLSYSFKDLSNFHLCVKTNTLTILAGMTGTGKSKLARLYADILDLSEANKNLLFLPISPNYSEPSDLIGYLNPINGLYSPSESGLTDILVKAHNKPDKMFIIIFDEMNLAQIEHWFAPFISILEEKETNRYLNLYSDKVKCINDFNYPSKLKIGSNLRFIGTMNMDETTRDISDRLLDRSNIITLTKNSFLDVKKILENKVPFEQSEKDYVELYNSWINDENPYENFDATILKFFDELHEIIISYDYQKGVSFRVLERMGKYLNNIPQDNNGDKIISIDEAIDLQLSQRVISKLKGSKKQFGELLGEYDFSEKKVLNSQLLSFIEKNTNISSFEKVKGEITRKSKELSMYGYAN